MHPAAEIRQQSESLRSQGRGEEADRVLEMAFSMAFMEASGLPCACRIAPGGRLASPAHGLVQVCRRSLLAHFASGVEQTPAASLHAFTPVARIMANIAARLPDDDLREIVVNFSDGCETEGDYPRVSPSCSRPDSVLIPDHHFANSEGYAVLRREMEAAPPWRERKDVVFWRGGGIGRPVRRGNFYPRLELCRQARTSSFRDRLDIGVTDLAGILDETQKSGAGDLVRPFVARAAFSSYRYQMDIDGWSNSWGLLEKLIMGATVLKVDSAFGYRQWFYDRLLPWRHYVPLAADLSDLDEKLAWLFSVPEEAEKIAASGRALAAEIRFAPEMSAAERRVEAALERVIRL